MLTQGELEDLVAASRQPDEVPHVAERLPAVFSAARRLLQTIQKTDSEDAAQADLQQRLLLCLRVARNAAALGGPPACAALLSHGLLDLVRATLGLVSCAAIALNWQLPAALAQALANACTACASAAAAVWAALFPLHLSMLAHVNAGATQAATCLALLACCRSVDGAAAALAGPQGAQMMTALLCNHHRMLQQGEHHDNLGLLAAHLAFAADLLPPLWASLGHAPGDGATAAGAEAGVSNGSAGAAGAVQQPTMAQAALLEALCSEAQDMPQVAALARGTCAAAAAANAAEAADAPCGRCAASTAFLVQLAEQLAAASRAAPLSAGQQQVLQGALHLMRDVCARDDSGAGLAATLGAAPGAATAPPPDLVAGLQAAGFLPALLAMLKALEPIQNPRQAAAAAAAPAAAPVGSGCAGGIQVAELAPALAARAAAFPATPPYPGYRSDLLAALANAAHQRGGVQAEVGALGGVELVLAQCQLDRASPLAREWALWGVRNLCEGNPAAQEAIRQLQLCTTVESEELQRLGVKLEMDEASGKLRVTQRAPPGAAGAAGAGAGAGGAAPPPSG